MMSLHRDRGANMGHRRDERDPDRKLLETSPASVAYAEVAIDGYAAMSGTSAMDKADDFLTSILGEDYDESESTTTVLSFTMRDRCQNYNLSRCGDAAPLRMDNKTVLTKVQPYRGTRPVEGKWYFEDEVCNHELKSEPLAVNSTHSRNSYIGLFNPSFLLVHGTTPSRSSMRRTEVL